MSPIQPQADAFSTSDASGAPPVSWGEPSTAERQRIDADEAVRQFTANLFNGRIDIRTTCDPEFDNSMQVVTVEAGGAVDELAKKSDFWHRHLHEAAKNLTSSYALSIVPLDECE